MGEKRTPTALWRCTHLPEPLVLHLGHDLVGVAHHGDEHVDEQQRHQHHVDEEDELKTAESPSGC